MTKNAIWLIGAMLLTVPVTMAAQRAANAYKATKISTQSVIVSCNDEREPVISHLDNTTAVVLTCTKK